MSPNPDACDEELPFSEGETIKVSDNNIYIITKCFNCSSCTLYSMNIKHAKLLRYFIINVLISPLLFRFGATKMLTDSIGEKLEVEPVLFRTIW